MLVLGIDIKDFFLFPFQGLQASAERCLSTAVLRVAQVLAITALPRPALINNPDEDCQLSQKRQKQDLRCRTYLYGTGILTCFPFLN